MGNFRNQATGSITALEGSVELPYRHFDNGAIGIQVTGTWAGTLVIEATLDGTVYVALAFINANTGATVSGATGFTANGIYRTELVGVLKARVRCSAYTSGTAVVTTVVLSN